MRGVLRPMVCECECDSPDAPPDVASGEQEEELDEDEELAHDHDHEAEGDESDLSLDEEVPEPADTDRPNEALTEAELAPVEVAVPSALVLDDAKEARASDYGITSLAPGSHLLVGEFTRKAGAEAFVVTPHKEVAVYGESGRLAREDLGLDVHQGFPPATLAVADPGRPVQAVDLVSDGTQQVAVATVEAGNDGQTLVWLTILKPVGGRIGRIFRAPLARLGAAGYEPVGRVDFLRGRQHRVLRYTPLDDGEASGWSEPQIFRWNRWEGMYRIPARPPTAPQSRAPHERRPMPSTGASRAAILATTGPVG